MVEMVQLLILVCFTLLYAIIGLALLVRLCLPFISQGSRKDMKNNEQ